MKTRVEWQRVLLAIAVYALMFFVSCSDPVTDSENVEPPIEEEPGDTPESADKLMEALSFVSGIKVSGPMPPASNTAAVRINVRDTIYIPEGITMPIRLSHAEDQQISGIFIAVSSSTFYYNVPVDREEESDTVSIIFIDVDPDLEGAPSYGQAKIIPYDENDQPMDVIERVLNIEKPVGSGCDITVPRPGTLPDTSGIWSPEWFWHHTIAFNGSGEPTFINAPGYAHVTETQYEGCCDFDDNKNCNVLSTNLNATVNVKISYTIVNEVFSFFTDGTFARQTHERKTNFDAETTQWCQNLPGYKYDDVVVSYQGTHSYVSGGSTISIGTDWASCDLCGYGSPGGSLSYTCNTLVISQNGGMLQRMYVRSPTSEWYD